jgi:primosomal protein N''
LTTKKKKKKKFGTKLFIPIKVKFDHVCLFKQNENEQQTFFPHVSVSAVAKKHHENLGSISKHEFLSRKLHQEVQALNI